MVGDFFKSLCCCKPSGGARGGTAAATDSVEGVGEVEGHAFSAVSLHV
jgi:hypothetical protein